MAPNLLFQIRSAGLMSISSQWLFFVPDTTSADAGVTSELEKSVDGENIAFIYNSKGDSTADCKVKDQNFKFWNFTG